MKIKLPEIFGRRNSREVKQEIVEKNILSLISDNAGSKIKYRVAEEIVLMGRMEIEGNKGMLVLKPKDVITVVTRIDPHNTSYDYEIIAQGEDNSSPDKILYFRGSELKDRKIKIYKSPILS